jgi:hypothetical protein
LESAPRIVSVVRATEIRVAPEVAGQLAIIKVAKGAQVHAGDEIGRNFWAEAVSNLSPLAFEPVSVGERELLPQPGVCPDGWPLPHHRTYGSVYGGSATIRRRV